MKHEIGDVMNSGLKQIGKFFENRFFLTAAFHRLVEFICTVFRFVDGVTHIYGEIGGNNVGDMGAAWNHKSGRQTKNTKTDGQTT